MAKIGITTAVKENPITTIHQSKPDLTPREGGKIRFPAPKKRENRAKPVIQISLVLFMLSIRLELKYTYFCVMQKTLTHRNSLISYSAHGKGNCVILLHGFLENKSIWNGLIPLLQNRYKIIAIDLPGHGASECLGYVHTMEDMAGVVKDVLKAERVRRSIFIGHSMGGYVSLAFADAFPKNVKGLCLLNSTAVHDSGQRKEFRDLGIHNAKKAYEKVVRISVRNLFSKQNQLEKKPEVAYIISEALKTPLQGYIAAQEGMKLRPNSEHVMKNASFPKLQITGKKDEVIRLEEAKKESNRTQTPLEILSGGHMSFIENPVELNQTLISFIRRC